MKSDKDLTAQLMRKTLGQQRVGTACRCHRRRTVTFGHWLAEDLELPHGGHCLRWPRGLPARQSQGPLQGKGCGAVLLISPHLATCGEVLMDTIWESNTDAKAVVPNEVPAC